MNTKRLIDAMDIVTKISKKVTPLIEANEDPKRVYDEVLKVIAEAPTFKLNQTEPKLVATRLFYEPIKGNVISGVRLKWNDQDISMNFAKPIDEILAESFIKEETRFE